MDFKISPKEMLDRICGHSQLADEEVAKFCNKAAAEGNLPLLQLARSAGYPCNEDAYLKWIFVD